MKAVAGGGEEGKAWCGEMLRRCAHGYLYGVVEGEGKRGNGLSQDPCLRGHHHGVRGGECRGGDGGSSGFLPSLCLKEHITPVFRVGMYPLGTLEEP